MGGVPFLSSYNARRHGELHQHRMFAIGVGDTVSAIILDCLELVQFILAQALSIEPGDPEGKAHQHKDGKNRYYHAPMELRPPVFIEQLRPDTSGHCLALERWQ